MKVSKLQLFYLAALSMLAFVATDMYLPAFKAMETDFATGPEQIALSLTVFLIGMASGQLLWGLASDKFGHRNTLFSGMLVFTLALLGLAFCDQVWQLLTLRFVQAIGGAAGIVIPRAVIRDNYDTQQAARALSLLMLIMGLAPILAPIVGGQVVSFTSWRALFWIMLGAGAALMLSVIFIMRETLAPERMVTLSWANIIGNFRALLTHRGFVAHSFAGGMGQAGMFAYIIGSPRVFIEVYHVDPKWYGVLFGINALSLIAASQVSARLLRTYKPQQLQRPALNFLACAGIATCALSVVGVMTLPILMVCLMGYMACQGFVNPNSAALALSDQGKRLGAASALLGTLQFTCGATAGLFVSIWQTESALPLATIMGICASLSWLSGRIARRAT